MSDISSIFTENKWGKHEDGVYITDGYTFKGKRPLQKVIKELKDLVKKGHKSEVNGVEFKVLDTRIKGSGHEIEIEIVEKNSRGNAVLKLYEPNGKKKKVSTVMVNKSKGSDSKFVTILAEKILKPLMSKFLDEEDKSVTEENVTDKSFVSVHGEEVKPLNVRFVRKLHTLLQDLRDI